MTNKISIKDAHQTPESTIYLISPCFALSVISGGNPLGPQLAQMDESDVFRDMHAYRLPKQDSNWKCS